MSNITEFKTIQENPNFIKAEHEVLAFWKEKNAFQTQLEMSKHKKPFTFYDGPPFATGLPHYGNLLAGTIKDVVCRYAAQTGHHVERKWGWDCHGLPIEFEIDKQHNIKNRDEVLKMGIDKYNNLCRGIVMKYSHEWKAIIDRFGRWIDMENDYKTMDLKFMESVWWVFKQIYEKKVYNPETKKEESLVYRGCKIMPYSNKCSTVLSNFEAQQNYEMVKDPAVHITFPLLKDPSVKLLAWTTTPWTLPSNLAVTVHPDFEYVKIKVVEDGQIFILAECRLQSVFSKPNLYEVLEKFKGKEMEGWQYEPLFNYFYDQYKDRAFKVTVDPYVTSDSGTGIVHSSPGFGEDDYRVCIKYGIIEPDSPPVPLDLEGNFTDEVSDFKGQYIKDADKPIKQNLKKRGRLFKEGVIEHNYPMCWRSGTPLIYKAVKCWFIKVTAIKEDLVKNNFKSNWVPKEIQEGRFNNWLASAKDWCFSRNRFWGNPIPIWASEDFEEVVCIGSVQELKERSGYKGEITDLHMDYIDHITIPSQRGKGVLRRIEEVFDCWFESGAMPYGQVHYPFSTDEQKFQKLFPADFIAEGLDQTRGWFYTLNVISTALRNDTPYKNLIVNGIVLAADGKKMSKSKKNYTPLMDAAETMGADAIRLYIINSQLVRAESLSFKDEGVKELNKTTFLPWYNSFKILLQSIQRYEQSTGKQFIFDESFSENKSNLSNVMDAWITITSHNLTKYFRAEMEAYRLYNVVPRVMDFLESLTNWYIKLNRARIRGEKGEQEAYTSLNILFNAVLRQTILMSSLVPFITEYFYQDIKRCIKPDSRYKEDSIHFVQIPEFNEQLIDEQVEQNMKNMQTLVFYCRKVRNDKNKSLKYPIKTLQIFSTQEFLDGIKPLEVYLKEEVNVDKVEFLLEQGQFSQKIASLDAKELSILYKKKFKEYRDQKKFDLTTEQIQQLENEGQITIEGEVCKLNQHFLIKVQQRYDLASQNQVITGTKDFTITLDLTHDEQLFLKGIAREFTSLVQKQRKACGMTPTDNVIIFYKTKTEKLTQAIQLEKENLQVTLKKPLVNVANHDIGYLKLFEKVQQNNKFDDEEFELYFAWESIRLAPEVQKQAYYPQLQKFLLAANQQTLLEQAGQDKKVTFTLEDGSSVTLEQGKDYFIGWSGLQ